MVAQLYQLFLKHSGHVGESVGAKQVPWLSVGVAAPGIINWPPLVLQVQDIFVQSERRSISLQQATDLMQGFCSESGMLDWPHLLQCAVARFPSFEGYHHY